MSRWAPKLVSSSINWHKMIFPCLRAVKRVCNYQVEVNFSYNNVIKVTNKVRIVPRDVFDDSEQHSIKNRTSYVVWGLVCPSSMVDRHLRPLRQCSTIYLWDGNLTLSPRKL